MSNVYILNQDLSACIMSETVNSMLSDHTDGLAQDCNNFNANACELPQFALDIWGNSGVI